MGIPHKAEDAQDEHHTSQDERDDRRPQRHLADRPKAVRLEQKSAQRCALEDGLFDCSKLVAFADPAGAERAAVLTSVNTP